MILACACGGVLETLLFTLAGMVAWVVLKMRSRK